MSILKKIIQFIFGNSRKDPTPTYSSVADTPVAKMKKAKQKALDYKKNNPDANRVVTFDQLHDRIRNNIFFLESLIESLEHHPKYLKYKNKVIDLKKQSEDSLKIMMRINKKAPYYQATMKSVVQHTNTVSKLINIPY